MSPDVAILTGASSGIGFAAARCLAAEGYALVVNSRTPEDAARRLAEEFGVETRAVPGDIADPATAPALARAAAEMGRVTALLLNHGGPPVTPILDIGDDLWAEQFARMVQGPLRVLRAAVPLFRAAGEGRVAAISSFTVKQPWAGVGLSNSLRAALVSALKTAALELGPENILINAVGPGYIATERLQNWNASFAAREGTTPEAIADRAVAQIPLRRYGRPEEVGELLAFLLSRRNGYVSGQQILCDGAFVVAS